MASAKFNLKNMDYFKFRKYVIDGNRDETSACSKEVASLCACVQTLNFRDDEFDPSGQDWARFDEICSGYKQILQGKRVESLDVRIKSGWWGEQKSGLSAGKIKASLLSEVLVAKTKDWIARHGESARVNKSGPPVLEKAIEGPGVYVFRHKEHSCFQLVQRASNVFQKCSDFLKSSFEGTLSSPLSALFVVSLVSDWDFYFVPILTGDSEQIIRVIENDLIIKHDSIWPHGLNLTLTLTTTFDLMQFRKSCVRHKWPPERDSNKKTASLDVSEVREESRKVLAMATSTAVPQADDSAVAASINASTSSISPPLPSPSVERPASARTPSTKVPQSSTPQPKTPRPSTASRVHAEQRKAETSAKPAKSSIKQKSTSDLNKSQLLQANKDRQEPKEPTKIDSSKPATELGKKVKAKENKRPEDSKEKETTKKTKDISLEEKDANKNGDLEQPSNKESIKNDFTLSSPTSEGNNAESSPQLKRSNTFTYDDDEEPPSLTTETASAEDLKTSRLPPKTLAIAKRISAQQN